LELFDDPNRAHQMAQARLQRADAFGAGKMVDDIEVLYEDLLAQRSCR
jgi:hypothetical protein